MGRMADGLMAPMLLVFSLSETAQSESPAVVGGRIQLLPPAVLDSPAQVAARKQADTGTSTRHLRVAGAEKVHDSIERPVSRHPAMNCIAVRVHAANALPHGWVKMQHLTSASSHIRIKGAIPTLPLRS